MKRASLASPIGLLLLTISWGCGGDAFVADEGGPGASAGGSTSGGSTGGAAGQTGGSKATGGSTTGGAGKGGSSSSGSAGAAGDAQGGQAQGGQAAGGEAQGGQAQGGDAGAAQAGAGGDAGAAQGGQGGSAQGGQAQGGDAGAAQAGAGGAGDAGSSQGGAAGDAGAAGSAQGGATQGGQAGAQQGGAGQGGASQGGAGQGGAGQGGAGQAGAAQGGAGQAGAAQGGGGQGGGGQGGAGQAGAQQGGGGQGGGCQPSGPEVCDGVDNNCNGVVDEGCPVCVPVTPTGDDQTADGTFGKPFGTVQAAIDFAANNGRNLVCVAANGDCNTTPHTYDGTATMADGVSVEGNYVAPTFTRCSVTDLDKLVTILQSNAHTVVSFGPEVQSETRLDGLQLRRTRTSGDVRAVIVDGSKQVLINGVYIPDNGGQQSYPDRSYGIELINGAEATIRGSSIVGGNGNVESIGIRSEESSPIIEQNCQGYDSNGRCNQGCAPITRPAIRGKYLTPGATPPNSYGVRFIDSPNAKLDASAVCGTISTNASAAVRIEGRGEGVEVKRSTIVGWGAKSRSMGVEVRDCSSEAPLISDNHHIGADGNGNSPQVYGISSEGACAPEISLNRTIQGSGESLAASTVAVHCGAPNGGVASLCTVRDNTQIKGSTQGNPAFAAGVSCGTGACAEISGNVITAAGGSTTAGVSLGRTAVLVERNSIDGGCGTTDAAGVFIEGSNATIQNNVILSRDPACVLPANGPKTSRGIVALVPSNAANISSLVVRFNTIEADGPSSLGAVCTAIDLAPNQSLNQVGWGIFTSNILRASGCGTRRLFAESLVAADPIKFAYNDLDPANAPTLYLDEGVTMITAIDQVNALFGVTTNMSKDPVFVNPLFDYHLQITSPLIAMGETNQVSVDRDNKQRSPTPSIGAYE